MEFEVFEECDKMTKLAVNFCHFSEKNFQMFQIPLQSLNINKRNMLHQKFNLGYKHQIQTKQMFNALGN